MDAEVIVEQQETAEMIIETGKRRNYAVGIALFAVAAGLAICRIGAFFLYDYFEALSYEPWLSEYLLDAIFTVVSQVFVCLLIPFLIYKFYQKRTAKQILADANYRKLSWKIVLCCIPLAIGCYLLTIYVVNWWLNQIVGLGYTYFPGSELYPKEFNPALLLLSIFLTAVLPAFCEEFIMRGNLVTSLRQSYKSFGVMLLVSIAFGLFHQNVIQLVYTAMFGGLMAFLVIKTRSVWPAVIIHFLNNAISVVMGYADAYGWGLASFMDGLLGDMFSVYIFLVFGAGIIVGFTALIINIAKSENKEPPVLKLYKPTMRDNAWQMGAIVLASLSTLFTFVFGLIS